MPLGQKRRKLGDIADIRAGYTFRDKPILDPNGDTHIVQASDIEKWNILDHPELLPTIENPSPNHKRLEPSDILLSARGRFHATVVLDDSVPIIASSSLFIISSSTGRIRSQFIAMYMNSHEAQRFFDKYSYGTNVKSLLAESVKELPVPDLTLEDQTRLLEFSNTISEQRLLLNRKQELLDQIFTTTLSKTLQGATT